jgi:hypothetical protein
MQLKITGAYSFADTYDVMHPEDGVIARAGRLTGAWRLVSDDGRSGNVHLAKLLVCEDSGIQKI